MTNIKISQLPSLGTLSVADQFPVVSGGTTYNVTANVAQSYMSTYPGESPAVFLIDMPDLPPKPIE